jgi:hypothetical protein
MAEGVGFEPTVPVKGRQFSRLEQSTALPPFRQGAHATKNGPARGPQAARPRVIAQSRPRLTHPPPRLAPVTSSRR